MALRLAGMFIKHGQNGIWVILKEKEKLPEQSYEMEKKSNELNNRILKDIITWSK